MTTATSPAGFIKGWHVLAGLVTFFGIIFAVNATMATLALKSFSGEDMQKPYVKGLAFNETLAARAAQAAAGWEATLDAVRGPDGATAVSVVVAKDGAPVQGLTLTATLKHPARASLDRNVTLQEKAGAYVATIDGLGAGQWTIALKAEPHTPDATPF